MSEEQKATESNDEKPKRTALETEIEELGLQVKVSDENAEKQWRRFAAEYRIIGAKAYTFISQYVELKTAIMIGDAEIVDDTTGVCIRQVLRRGQSDAPKSLTYKPPGVMQIAAGGTDDVTLAHRWTRIAAMCSGHNEGEFARWLFGRDRSLMETIAQLFTQV